MAPTAERYDDLHGLRALAALCVVLHHWMPATAFTKAWHIPLGYSGVRLFFVLSGFLITEILIRQRAEIARGVLSFWEAAGRFYLARFFRIIPLAAVTLGALFILDPSSRQYIWWHLSFASDEYPHAIGSFIPSAGHYWTIAVEWKFYAIWGALMLCLPRKTWLPMMLIALVASPLFRAYLPSSPGVKYSYAEFMLPGTLDAFALGAIIAWAKHFRPTPWLGRLFLIVGAAMAVACWACLITKTWDVLNIQAYNTLGLALISAWLVFTGIRGFGGWFGSFLRSAPMQFLGTISFGVYIFHMLAPALLRPLGDMMGLEALRPYYWSIPMLIGSTLVFSTASWFLFEKPSMRFGAKLARAIFSPKDAAPTEARVS